MIAEAQPILRDEREIKAQRVIDLNDSHEAIYINDHLVGVPSSLNPLDDPEPILKKNPSTVVKFEIFESSSDDELSQCAFESAALSYSRHQDKLLRAQENQDSGEEEALSTNLIIVEESQAERERKLRDR